MVDNVQNGKPENGRQVPEMAQRVREARGALSRKAFAELVDVSEKAVQRWEEGAIPGSDHLAEIVRGTGCNPRWLLMGESEAFPSGPLADPAVADAVVLAASVIVDTANRLLVLAIPHAEDVPDAGQWTRDALAIASLLKRRAAEVAELYGDPPGDPGTHEVLYSPKRPVGPTAEEVKAMVDARAKTAKKAKKGAEKER